MDEFTVRSAATISNKKHSVFKLHKDDAITWTEAKIRRDNDYQPWQIKLGSGRAARRFKAIKEGGVNDNASYFIFYKPADSKDTYEVCPVDEWYSVSATQRYKTLTAEEAEQKFEQRHKMLNFFSVMHLKKNGENGDELVGGTSKQNSKSFKISELDDWDQSGEDDGSDNEDDNDNDESKKKLRRKKNAKVNDPDDAPEEGKEESDEGDFEQREVDYMSDTSSSSSDENEDKNDDDVKGIAEEDALRELLSTDDEEDAENSQQKSKTSDSKTNLATVDIKQDPDGNSSEDSLDSDDYDVDEEKMDSMFMKKGLPSQLTKLVKNEETESGPSSNRQQYNSNSGTNNKRKTAPEVSTPPTLPPPKRPCISDTPSSSSSQAATPQERIVEDLIRKYLSRKPMTPKNLLREIRNKMKRIQGATPELNKDLVNTIATVIKRLQPDKQKINEVIYLSLKS